MADTTTPAELDSDADEPELTEYTTESETPVGRGRASPAASGPGAATGRRKQAIARVRIVPGTGEWTINGRTLDDYFPNKVHQQIVNEPFKVLELDGSYDVLVRVHGGGPSGQAGAVRLGVARSLNGVDEELNRPALKKAGFLTRDAARPGAQEGRSQEGPQGSAVQQALIPRPASDRQWRPRSSPWGGPGPPLRRYGPAPGSVPPGVPGSATASRSRQARPAPSRNSKGTPRGTTLRHRRRPRPRQRPPHRRAGARPLRRGGPRPRRGGRLRGAPAHRRRRPRPARLGRVPLRRRHRRAGLRRRRRPATPACCPPRPSRSSPPTSAPTSASCSRPRTTPCRTTASSSSPAAATSWPTTSRTPSRPRMRRAVGAPHRRRRRPRRARWPTAASATCAHLLAVLPHRLDGLHVVIDARARRREQRRARRLRAGRRPRRR